MIALSIITALVAAVVSYLQASVPLAGPSMGHADVIYYWPVALIAGLVVLTLTTGIAWLSMRAGREGK